MMTWQQKRIGQLEDKAVRLMQLYERLERRAAGKSGEDREQILDRLAEISLTISTVTASLKRLENNTPI